MSFNLAAVNIANAIYSYEDPEFSGFVDNLDRINALADAAPGFVWRYISDDEDAEVHRIFANDMLLFNMSVWESRNALHDYVYKSGHVEILRQRAKWFTPMDQPTLALWWQEAGTIPTILEAKHRLDLLMRAGPTQDAFTFRNFFDAPTEKDVANA